MCSGRKSMYHYCIYGMHLASDIEFPQLVKEQDESSKVDLVIEEDIIDDLLKDKANEKDWELGDNYSWFVNRVAWYEITNGNQIKYQLKPERNIPYLRSFLLGLAISMLIMQRKMLAVHCSAVYDQDGAILVAGESGSGKSTLTTELLRSGYTLAADDMIAVGLDEQQNAIAYPAFPFQKLCRDAAIRAGYDTEKLIYIDEDKDKFLVPYEGDFSLNPIKVKKLVWLSAYQGEEAMSREIEGLDKVKLLYQNLFLRQLLKIDKVVNPKVFHLCLEIASKIDIKMIVRPKEGNTIMKVKEFTLQ